MPITRASIGMGSIFSIGNGVDGASTTYTDLGEVTAVETPGLTREAIDATHLLSPDLLREYIAGLTDTNECKVSFDYVPSEGDLLYTTFNAGKGDFQLTYPNGVRLQFVGIPTAWAPGNVSEGKMEGEYTIKPTGKPVLLAA